MNIREIVESIDKVINTLAPFASIVGMDKYAKLAQAGLDIVEKLVNNLETATEVLSSDDEAFIRSKLAELQAVNDALIKRVEES